MNVFATKEYVLTPESEQPTKYLHYAKDKDDDLNRVLLRMNKP